MNQSITLLLGDTVLATRELPVSPDTHANEGCWCQMDWVTRLTTACPLAGLPLCNLLSLDSRIDMTDHEGECCYHREKYVSFWEKLDRNAFIQTILSLKDEECSWDKCLKTSLWSDVHWQVCQLQRGSAWVSSVRLQMAGELDRVALAFNLSTYLFYIIFLSK